MKLYLSGVMSQHKEWNFSAFNNAEKALTAVGYEVINPSKGGHDGSWVEFILEDIMLIWDHADGVAILPFDEEEGPSAGVQVEVAVAQKKGIPIKELSDWISPPSERCKPGNE